MLQPNLEANAAGGAAGADTPSADTAPGADTAAAGADTAAAVTAGAAAPDAAAPGVTAGVAAADAAARLATVDAEVDADAWAGAVRVGGGSAAAAALNWYRPIGEQACHTGLEPQANRLEPRTSRSATLLCHALQ